MRIENLELQTPYLNLDEEFYRLSEPIPLEEPYLICYSKAAAELIDLDVNEEDEPLLSQLLNGSHLPKGSKPFAMCYAGHQFGHFNPWLGDGRTHNLGQISGWNLQLKGSGETYYARTADGRAALPSSIREFLMSEAMYHLGIATTRALGLVGSKTKLIRKQMEDAAIVMRLSSSWVRFGSFEYLSYMGEKQKLSDLAEYVIAESYPHLKEDEDRFYKMFCEVVDATASLIAQWQAIGFCHGVMNTDNMSIAGLTIDYGPFAMLDDFNYSYVCNSSDRVGRYTYGQQPNIAYWNLTQLANALKLIIPEKKMQAKLSDYGDFIYPNAYVKVMRKKLGLEVQLDDDVELIKELVGTLQDVYVDHTLFYRTLSHYDGDRAPLYDIVMEPVIMDEWLKLYDARLTHENKTNKQRQEAMLRVNPKYILKNYMLEEAIAKAKREDFSMVQELLYIASHPYDELPEFEHFAGDTPEEFKNLPLSCSS